MGDHHTHNALIEFPTDASFETRRTPDIRSMNWKVDRDLCMAAVAQAGVPFDSRATPEPPASWYNNGSGGVTVNGSGSAVAFSGRHRLATGERMSFAWSLLVTPVRPFNLSSHFSDRWAQLDGPGGDYTQYKKAGVTVINMHHSIVNPCASPESLSLSLHLRVSI